MDPLSVQLQLMKRMHSYTFTFFYYFQLEYGSGKYLGMRVTIVKMEVFAPHWVVVALGSYLKVYNFAKLVQHYFCTFVLISLISE